MFSIFLLLIDVFIGAKPTDTSFGNKKQYTELSFNVGFFTKMPKNKELTYLLPLFISSTQVLSSGILLYAKGFILETKVLIMRLLL